MSQATCERLYAHFKAIGNEEMAEAFKGRKGAKAAPEPEPEPKVEKSKKSK